MGSPEARERRPGRMKPVKAWAVVDFDGALSVDQYGNPRVFRYRWKARAVANDLGLRVIPVVIHSCQHKPR